MYQTRISAPHAHNLALEWMVEGGIVGLLVLLFLLWKMFRVGFELVMHTNSRLLGAAVIACGTGLCVCGMFDYPLFTPKIVAAVLVALSFTDALGAMELSRPYRWLPDVLPFYERLKNRKTRDHHAARSH